jgi:hypothetical protein
MISRAPAKAELWPSLPLVAWQDTYVTLHMVDPDGGEDSAGACSAGQPLVALRSLRFVTRTCNLADALVPTDV